MRVLIATPAPERGGVWKHVLDLAEGVRERGHEVELAFPSAVPELVTDAENHGFTWHPAPAVDAAAHADLVHVHLSKTFDPALVKWLPLWRLKSRTRVVLTEHLPRAPVSDSTMARDPDTAPGRRKPGARHAKTVIKQLEVMFCSKVILVSEHSKQFMVNRYGLSPRRLHAIPNGTGVVAEIVAPPGEDLLRIACVGTLSWRKGCDVLLDAAALASQPWSITVVGDGPARAALQERAVALPDSITVTFTGNLREAARVSLDADLICLPSRAEAMPYSVLEAMACGRPVVASAVDGVSELVADGVTGTLVPAEDAAALAAALDALALDPQLRAQLGEAARQRQRTQFTLDLMVDRTLAVYGLVVAP
jgi:glycosyltransferase involved in cell wall biosynthesis